MDFKHELALKISAVLNLDIAEIEESVEIPANTEMGDYSYPCFKLAKLKKKAPNIIAQELAIGLGEIDFVDSIEVVVGYVNFRLNKAYMAEAILKKVLEAGADYGRSDMGKGKTIVMDYSSPNIAKPLHIGHIRTTMIGNALYKTQKFLGYNVVGINYLGDWGTQFGKMIVAIRNWGDKKTIETGGLKELVNLYIKFHDEADENPSLNDEARSWMLKMQNGDEEAMTLWQEICDISRKELDKIYKRLNITFDSYRGESYYNDKMAPVVEELRAKGLMVESDGAQVVNLEEYDMPPCLILRKDGGTLYPTRDIAAAMDRMEMYNLHKSLYITGLEQKLHFAQWFKVVELMGYEWAKDLVHIPYGMISLDSGKLSTRKGNVIYLEDLLDEAVSRTLNLIEERNPTLENKEEVAEQVGIGAVIFNDLYNNRIKDVAFSWEKMLSADGETGPYVQYACVRAYSVLQRAEFVPDKNIDYALLSDEASINIIKLLYSYPDKLIESAEKYEPYIIARHLIAIAQAFNYFYRENPILTSEGELKKARLHLTYAVREVLKAGLGLIGIQTPDKM